MTGKELFAIMARGEMPPRIPFVPSIYEHSARVIDETPSRVARDENLIVKSQLACYELLLENRKFALELLDFSLRVGVEFARAFSERGVGVSINESWISSPLLSPALYRECVYPYEKEMIGKLNDMGMENVALISGGDTTAIADYMVKTGTSLLMADYNTDQEYYKNVCAENNILLRASMNAGMVEEGDENKLRGAVKKVLENCADYEKFIFGCGVVSYDTTTENVLLLKKIVQELDNRKSLK